MTGARRTGESEKVELRWYLYSCVFRPHKYCTAIFVMNIKLMFYMTFHSIKQLQLVFHLYYVSATLNKEDGNNNDEQKTLYRENRNPVKTRTLTKLLTKNLTNLR